MKPGTFCATQPAISTSMISQQALLWLNSPSEAPASQVRRKTPAWRQHLPAWPHTEPHPPPSKSPVLNLVVPGTFFPSETGTNDKPGGPHYILRWTSPQAVKETHVPLTDWRYAYMQ